VIVFSSEMPELISLCDRVIVMVKNRIQGEVSKGSGMTQEAIMARAAAAQPAAARAEREAERG
jgi:ABC-type sugar transport system ATPase subunit